MRVIDVVNGLTERMRQQGQLYAEATVVVQGMDEKGDFVELQLLVEVVGVHDTLVVEVLVVFVLALVYL